MLKQLIFSLSLLLVISASAFGQITISTNDFMPAPGTSIQYPTDIMMDGTFFNSLRAGSGGPTVWDFSSRFYSTGSTAYSLALGDTPAIDSFPEANLVTMIPSATDTSWIIYKSTSTEFTQLGTVSHVLGMEYPLMYYDIAPDWVFPVSYNDTWISFRHWSSYSTDSYQLSFDTTVHTVDAWGTAKYKTNSIPCLRVIDEKRVTVNTYDNSDHLLGSTTQDVTMISFVTTGFDILASATKLTFGSFDSYSSTVTGHFIDVTSDVEDENTGTLPTGFSLSQNYPNPFNPDTKMSLSVPERSHVKLTVYDVLGREVATIVDKVLPAGSYTATWDGKNRSGEQVASGIYFYNLITDQYRTTRKMVLLK